MQIKQRWTDETGKIRSTVIAWNHEGARQEVERLERVLEKREQDAHLNSSAKKER